MERCLNLAFRSGSSRRRQQLAATVKSTRLGLSTEFTRWKQRLDPKNAASTGMKPVESHGPYLRLVATNYRPTGIKPVVANRRKKCFTASPPAWKPTFGKRPFAQTVLARFPGAKQGCFLQPPTSTFRLGLNTLLIVP